MNIEVLENDNIVNVSSVKKKKQKNNQVIAFLITVTKSLTRSNFKEEGLFGLAIGGHGPSWWGWHSSRILGQLVSSIQSQKTDRNECWCPVGFLLLIQSRMPTHGQVFTIFKLGLLFAVKSFWKHLQTHPLWLWSSSYWQWALLLAIPEPKGQRWSGMKKQVLVINGHWRARGI